MEINVTTCCKEKRTDPGLLPAIERYLSERIQRVQQQSLENDRLMLIFSGKYGLLSPEDPIPWYDQKLENNAVEKIVPLLVTQLESRQVKMIHFFCRPRGEPGWEPYHEALEQACRQAGVKLSLTYTSDG